MDRIQRRLDLTRNAIVKLHSAVRTQHALLNIIANCEHNTDALRITSTQGNGPFRLFVSFVRNGVVPLDAEVRANTPRSIHVIIRDIDGTVLKINANLFNLHAFYAFLSAE